MSERKLVSDNASSGRRRVWIVAALVTLAVCACIILASGFLFTTRQSATSARPTFALVISTLTVAPGAPPTYAAQSTPEETEPISAAQPTPAPAQPTAAPAQPSRALPQPSSAPPKRTPTPAQPTAAPAQPSAPPTETLTPPPTVDLSKPSGGGGPAQVSTGELHFDYPLTLEVDRDDIVKVEIIPAETVALAAPLNASAPSARLLIESGTGTLAHKTVSYTIPLYPVIAAELATARAQDLNIVAGSESKQMMAPHESNFWTWSLVAKRSGEYRITLRVFGYNALSDADPARTVVDDTRVVNVQDRSLTERLSQGLADNWLVLFGAGGPIALIIAVLSVWFARRDLEKRKKEGGSS